LVYKRHTLCTMFWCFCNCSTKLCSSSLFNWWNWL